MKERLRKLQSLFDRKSKIYFGFLVLLMAVGSLFELLGIGAIPAFLQVMANPQVILNWPVVGGLLGILNIQKSEQIFLFFAWGLILIYLIKNIYLGGLSYLKANFAKHRRIELGKRLFTTYMHAPYTFHLQRNTAELLRNSCVEVRILCLEVIKPLLEMLTNMIVALAIIILLLSLKFVPSLIVLGLLGAAGFIFLRATRGRVTKYGQQEQEGRKVEYQSVNEGIGGFREAQLANRESFFIRNYYCSSLRTAQAHLFSSVAGSLSRPVMEFLAVSGMILLIILLKQTTSDLVSLIPTLGLFVIAILKLQINLNQLASNFTKFKYNLYSVDPIYDDITELDAESGKKSVTNFDQSSIHFYDEIKLSNISYRYPGTSKPVLHDISLNFKKNASVGIVGPTGSGKTTLLNILLGFLTPESGMVKVDNQRIADRISAWQQHIGYIPQDIYLADQSIKRNIAFGYKEPSINEKQIAQSLKMAHLFNFVDELPEKTETLIGERGVRLSGGQQQRIGIARALYHDPEVLVMDEATASLDTTTERSVMQALDEAKEGRTFIMIAHRLSTVKNCDIIYLLEEGRLVSQGSYEHLAKHSEIFKQMIADTA